MSLKTHFVHGFELSASSLFTWSHQHQEHTRRLPRRSFAACETLNPSLTKFETQRRDVP